MFAPLIPIRRWLHHRSSGPVSAVLGPGGQHRARRGSTNRPQRSGHQRWPFSVEDGVVGRGSDPDDRAGAVLRGAGAPTRIGITGHSDLTAPSVAIVRAALRRWLRTQARPPWVGVSCLASGADQLFAALTLDLGAELEVILPARDYRARKVEPSDAAEFDRLLAAAATVTVLDVDRSCREAYMAASTALLAGVDEVVAVWDGHPARRHGPTGDVVDAARRLGLPVSVLWPTGATRHPPLPGSPGPGSPVSLVLAGLVFPRSSGRS